MLENNMNDTSSQNDEYDNSFTEYLSRAARACASGHAVLGMHLYLAAFERARHPDGSAPDAAALEGLKQAWNLACSLKERPIAEYVFERLEPYLSSDEAASCVEQLQNLAFDKLEEFGLTREDLQNMTDVISQDFFETKTPLSSSLLQVEHINLPASDKAKPSASFRFPLQTSGEKSAASPDKGKKASSASQDAPTDASASKQSSLPPSMLERLSYDDLVGYDKIVDIMRNFGIGVQDDPQFQSLVKQLNSLHGLDRMPATDTFLFCSPAREDANHFMAATLGELNLPVFRMRMAENLQGMPVLCIMAQTDKQPTAGSYHHAFEGAGVLLLEDLDLWVSPALEPVGDDFGGVLIASLSRGVREAIALIRSAVENPDVFVLASASDIEDIDPFFCDLLQPLSIVDIDYPTRSERADIWAQLLCDHPSLQGIDQQALVGYSAHLSRFDIYMAAREAVEEAYKDSLATRCYLPVAAHNLFEKLAAYQPLDSKEYQALENAVVNDLKQDLNHLEDLLWGKED